MERKIQLGWFICFLFLQVSASAIAGMRGTDVWHTSQPVAQSNLTLPSGRLLGEWIGSRGGHTMQGIKFRNRQFKKETPWRHRATSVVYSGLVSMPLAFDRRYVVCSIAVLSIANVINKLKGSEPIQRSLYFWQHAGPIVAHYKFTKWWLTLQKADRDKRDMVFESLHNQYALPALDLALHLRGLYVKMGQILSSRPDFMPPQYIHLFTELQDSIPPLDTQTVQTIALEAWRRECPAIGNYEHLVLDHVPLGSASIGQVHRAVLQRKRISLTSTNVPSVREVAVKVMHRGAKAKFQTDFQVFRWLCRIAIPSWRGLLDALEQQVMTEFDYRKEANALKEVRNNMRHSMFRNRVCVPEPIEELCCEDVLVMELLHGKKLIDSIRDRLKAAVGGKEETVCQFLATRRRELLTGEDAGSMATLLGSTSIWGKLKLFFLLGKCRRIIDLLVDVHGYQIFRMGTWNGDPHFGNCLQMDDGRLGLIDYGQTRRMDTYQRIKFAKVVVALNQNRSNVSAWTPSCASYNASVVADAMRDAGFATRNNVDNETMLQYARLLFDSDEESQAQGFTIPQEYFKSLMDSNPLVSIPDSAIFVGRTSLMFRGMGSAIGSGQIRTAPRWYKHARFAVQWDRQENDKLQLANVVMS